jgi:glycine/D-amino acid oxidase-like deaminating enzyme
MLHPMWPFRRSPAHRIRSSEPYWLLRNGMGDARRPLEHSLECDVAVVGAGITGALIVDALMADGKRIVVLDSRDVALGSTAATTALLQYEIDTHLTDLAARLGGPSALRAYQACAATFEILERRYPDLLRLANYQRRESLYLAKDERAVPVLQAELAARRAAGLACEWLEHDELVRRFGCRRPGAILSALGAELDPVRFTQALFAGAERHGARVYAGTKVQKIEENGATLRLTTGAGRVVDAGHVIVAAGFEALDFLPRKVANINNTYALVTYPLADPRRAAALPLTWESARPYLYLRGTPDGRLIVGGADVPFSRAEARDLMLSRQTRRLAAGYQELFGEDLPPVAWAWGGSFAETEDGLPYIGTIPGMHPRLQFALCYGGNGITFSVLAAQIVRAGVDGRVHELAGLFGFARQPGKGE